MIESARCPALNGYPTQPSLLCGGGVAKTRVLVWVYGHELRAVHEHIVLAEYDCRYDLRDRQVKDIRDWRFYKTDFASDKVR